MTFFNYSEPVLRRKQTTVEIQELKGLWFVNWQIGKIKLYSGIFLLPYVSGWQFLSTGALMVFCLLLLAEFQWDGL